MATAKTDQTSKAERKRPFNLQIPESLYDRLKNYTEEYGRKKDKTDSMTNIIVEALKEKLDKLYAKAEK